MVSIMFFILLIFFVSGCFSVYAATPASSTTTIYCTDIGNALSNYQGKTTITIDGIQATEVSSAPSKYTSELSFTYANGVSSGSVVPCDIVVNPSGSLVYTLSPITSESGYSGVLYYIAPISNNNTYNPTTINQLEKPVNAYDSGLIPNVLDNIIFPIMYGILGLLVFALVSYAGFLWMTSKGDPKNLDKAKSVLTGAVIGAIIILLAYVISLLLISGV